MTETIVSTHLHRIPSLSGAGNYNTWRIQMQDILTDLNLFEYVDRTKKCPTEVKSEDPNSEHSKWLRNDRKALINIRLRVSEHVLTHIQSSVRSADAWELLDSTFKVKGTVGLIDLRRKFFSHRMKESDELEEHIQRMRTWYQQINEIAPSSCTEADWITTLVASLPDSWDTFVQAVDLDLDLDDKNKLANQVTDIRARIIAEAHRRGTWHDGAMAYYSQSKSRHQKREHASGKYGQNSHKHDKSNSQCHNCGRYGHWAADCQYPGGGAYEPSNSDTDESEYEESPNEDSEPPKGGGRGYTRPHTHTRNAVEDSHFAFIASDSPRSTKSSIESQADAWIADSGTTTHVANNRNAFTEYTQVNEFLTGINGKQPILGRGTVLLRCRINSKQHQYRNITLTNVAHVPTSPTNLISLSAATDHGYRIVMQRNRIKILSRSNHPIAFGRKEVHRVSGNLWKIDCQVRKSLPTEHEATASVPSNPKMDSDAVISIKEEPNKQLIQIKETEEIAPTGGAIDAYNEKRELSQMLTKASNIELAPKLSAVSSDTIEFNEDTLQEIAETGGASERVSESKWTHLLTDTIEIEDTTHIVNPEPSEPLTNDPGELPGTDEAHESNVNEAE